MNKQILQETVAGVSMVQLVQNGTSKFHDGMWESGIWIIQKLEQGIHGGGKEFLGHIRLQGVYGLCAKIQSGRGLDMLQQKGTGLQNIHQVQFKLGTGLPVTAQSPGRQNVAYQGIITVATMGDQTGTDGRPYVHAQARFGGIRSQRRCIGIKEQSRERICPLKSQGMVLDRRNRMNALREGRRGRRCRSRRRE